MTESQEAHELTVVFPIDVNTWSHLGIKAQRQLVEQKFKGEAERKGIIVRYDGYSVEEGVDLSSLNLPGVGQIDIVRATGWVIPNAEEQALLDG